MSKKSFQKFINFFKQYPTIVTLAIVVPSLIMTIRYMFIEEYYYYNFYYSGERLLIEDENFELTEINKVAKVYQSSSSFSYQGGACYHQYYAVCADNFEAIVIYDTDDFSKGPVHIINTGIVNTDWHCNQMFFGSDFYSAHDKFPLLYISMESPKVHSLIAFRIYQLGGDYFVSLIQKLTLTFDDGKGPLYYPNAYYDYEESLIYYGGYTKNTYMKEDDNFIRFYTFPIVDYRTTEETLSTCLAADCFELPSETATQGGFISNHHLYQTFSFNSKTNPLKAPKMRVVDLENHVITKDYQDLYAQFGVAEEFEHVAINDNGRMYSLGNPFNIYEFKYKG